MTIKVLFVCLGNICRSPTAHGLFQHKVEQSALSENIMVDSAGTGGWHTDSPPDERAQQTALTKGYDISHLRARAVNVDDFKTFDYILAMDKDNLTNLLSLKPYDYQGTLGLFLDVAGVGQGIEVPDPYYGGREHFENAINLIEEGAEGLLSLIRKTHGY